MSLSNAPFRRPTLADVARGAGVSIATASRVLNGGVASPAARARVDAAADSLGYIPNAHAQSLRRERTMTIGVAFFSLKLPGALDMLESLSRQLDDSGYTLLIADTAGDVARFDRILARFLERRVDALICVNPHNIGPVLDRFLADGIPAAAVMSRGRGAAQLPLFGADLRPAVEAAVARLIELGHSRVSAVLPGGEAGPFRAVWKALRASGLAVDAVNPFSRDFSGAEVMAHASSRGGASAIISTYPVALELLRAARAANVAVPRDVSLLAVSDDPGVAELLETPLSAIEVDLGALGQAVADAMLTWLSGDPPARNTLVPVSSWVERATTGPAGGAANQ
ncbi:MAG TPA: LacI family DNA-binding transcriptional regulator [Tepidiformaceae bacterium]|nr:LacI family DNA-binding transcriptional regulator [Tepidiformaceae bacterium]